MTRSSRMNVVQNKHNCPTIQTFLHTRAGMVIWTTLESYHLIFKLKRRKKEKVLHLHETWIANRVTSLCRIVLYIIVTRNSIRPFSTELIVLYSISSPWNQIPTTMVIWWILKYVRLSKSGETASFRKNCRSEC